MTALLPEFRRLGIELGKPWNRNKVEPVVLASMRRAAQDIAPMLSNLPVGHMVNGWIMPPASVGDTQADYLTRAVVARVGLTANTPQEAVYCFASTDVNGRLLSGENRYTITFRNTPPYVAPGFWSVTMYDATNNYTIDNPLNRYSLGSDSEMKFNRDGSLTLVIQKETPSGDQIYNWLPAPPGPFYLILRVTVPGEAMVESLSNPAAASCRPIEPAE